jgi:hypothetical protein
MRNLNRIPICLKLLFINKTLYHFLGTNTPGWAKKLHKNWGLIEKEWLKYPDSRFGQLLSYLNLVDKEIEDRIWNIEEDIWLIKNGYCNIEDITFWGVNFYKNGKQRKTVKFVLLKDLKTDHIQNIIKFFEDQNMLHKLNKEYLEYFNKRINNGG